MALTLSNLCRFRPVGLNASRLGGRIPLTREHLVRRLTAIFAADVAGYSRLTGLDEEGTHVRLKEHLRVLIDPKVAAHRGHIIKNTGDGLLAEFNSVVDAMRCAVDVQRGMAERNSDVPPGNRIEFRIGINVGDIIEDNGDIFGDGVNIAARLEAIAEPGGICVSDDAHRQRRDKLDIVFDDAGEQNVKNIERPVRVFRVMDRVGVGRQRPTLALPNKPSIAVLPFQNLSADPEQEYFADGVVEEITMALSRFHWLFVIARNSSFTYKGRAIDVKQVGRELGVRYVLEGGVRKARGWMTERVEESAEAMRLARKAVHLGGDDPVALCMGGYALAYVAHEFDDAAAFMDRGLALNPNAAQGWMLSGWLRVWRGEPDLALDHLAHAMRLSPFDPLMYGIHGAMAYAHFLASRYDIASSYAEKAMRDNPTCLHSICISAASNAFAGRLEPAQKAMARALEFNPGLRASNLRDLAPFRRAEDLASFAKGLRKAGLPE